MADAIINLKRESRERRLAALFQEHGVVEKQWLSAVNERDRLLLKRQLSYLESEIEEVDVELAALQMSSGERRLQETIWKAYLPQIDFQEAHETFLEIDQRLHGGGCALLLLQNYHALGGRWFLARMRETLRQQSYELRHLEIELAAGARLSVLDVLNKLSRYLDCEPCPTDTNRHQLRRHALKLIDQLCGSMHSGNIVLLEVRVWDTVDLHEQFLPWLLQDLYLPLVAGVKDRVKYQPFVKLFVVIAVNPPLKVDGQSFSWYCTRRDFDNQKVLELPLTSWKETDIGEWLFQYSGLSSPQIGLTRERVAQIAHDVYLASSDGQPALVETALMHALSTFYNR